MRKSRRALGCGILALALILTGTGFALWSDTLNVTTTATTGDFGVTFVDLGLLAQYPSEMSGTEQKGWSIVDGITGEMLDTSGNKHVFEDYIPEWYFARGTSNYNNVYGGWRRDAYLDRATPYSNIDFTAELVDAAPIPPDNGVYNSENANGSKQIVITIDNMYPGYAQAFRTDIINVGTLAAQLSNIKFAVSQAESVETAPSEELKAMLGIAVLIKSEDYRGGGQGKSANVFKLCTTLGASADDIFTVGEVDFLRLSALEKAGADKIAQAIENGTLLVYPGADTRMDLFLGVAMDPDAAGKYTSGTAADRLEAEAKGETVKDDAMSQNGAVKITMDLLWDQFNAAAVNADIPGNILSEQNANIAAPPAE